MRLLPIGRDGTVPAELEPSPDMLRENCAFTSAFYKVVGFEPPWIGYVSVNEGVAVGGGAFKGPPRDKRAEIAYYTLPGFEGRGFATATAIELIRIARASNPGLIVTAQTLPEPNASTTLLEKLGFSFKGSVSHPEDGVVWQWELDPAH